MNKSYMSMYNIIDQARIIEGQLHSALLKLKKNEDLIKRIEAIKIAQAEELSRLREKNKQLEDGLWPTHSYFGLTSTICTLCSYPRLLFI